MADDVLGCQRQKRIRLIRGSPQPINVLRPRLEIMPGSARERLGKTQPNSSLARSMICFIQRFHEPDNVVPDDPGPELMLIEIEVADSRTVRLGFGKGFLDLRMWPCSGFVHYSKHDLGSGMSDGVSKGVIL